MSKRANQEGSIHKKKNNRWEAQVMIGYRENGSRLIKSFYGATRKEAKQKMDDYLAKRKSGLLAGETSLFGDFADRWLEHHAYNVSETTAESYRYTLRILKDHLGSQSLASIKAYHIENFLRRLRCTYSDSTVAKCRAMLFQIFQKAVASDLLTKNPVAFAEKMKTQPKKRRESFTAEEVQLLMDNLPEDRIGWSIRLMVATGMRCQEVLGLACENITEDGSFITVNQALVRVKGGVHIGDTKTFASRRIIPVPESIQYCARALRETAAGKFIWNSPKIKDQPCNPSWFAKLFKRALESVDGVRVLSPHSCRHTYISMLQMLNVDFETIRDLSGHVEVDTTRHYLHVQDQKRLDAAQQFSEAFSRKASTR